MKIILVNPRPELEWCRGRTLQTIAKIPGGYVVDDYLESGKTFGVRYDEYIEIKPVTEIEILKAKVYKYELLIGRLLIEPDLIIQSAVRNELARLSDPD